MLKTPKLTTGVTMLNTRSSTVATAIMLLVFAGCGKPDAELRFQRPNEVTDFAVLFGKNCSGCHGMDGQLGPAPPLNDPLLQSIISDEQIRDTVRRGRAGTLMPAFARWQGGPLTERQVDIIVQGVRQQWAKPVAVSAIGLPAYQVALDDSAGLAHSHLADGKKLYADVCSGCHGDRGQGTSDAGGLRDHALAELISDQLLRRIIITGRADLGMPSYVDSGTMSSLGRPLTSDEVSNLAAYVRSLQRASDKAVATADTK
jgi:mono/diheme cytochrome c family protein